MEGARAGSVGCKTGSREDAMPFPPTVAYKALPAALALSASSSLPVYLVPVVLSIVSRYAFVACSKTELHSFIFVSPFLSLLFNPAHPLCCVGVAPRAACNAEEEVPRGFLPASSCKGFWDQQGDCQWR